MIAGTESRTYDVAVEFDPYVATVHLGSQKYTTATRALGELVANSLDAGARTISVNLEVNGLDGVEAVSIEDDGEGITPAVITSRFRRVGRFPLDAPEGRLGKFGVGRLAVHRIGTLSHWSTVAELDNGDRVLSSFSFSSDDPQHFSVVERRAPGDASTGTRIQILNLLESAHAALIPSRIANDLLAQFCSYLAANPDRQIVIQGDSLDFNKLVESSEEEVIETETLPSPVTLRHLMMRSPVDNSRFPAQLLFAGHGRTVHSCQPADVPSSYYLGIAESPYFDSIVTSNRESIIEMDPAFQEIMQVVQERITAYREGIRHRRSARFIETARLAEYYPFRSMPTDALSHVRRELFDVAIERINEHANIEKMTRTQQAVVFRLLNRALENENILDILDEVAALSDEDVKRFRRVLERTTLDSIIRLSSEVTDRLRFLDVLHELVYGEVAKHLKERSQLHKILEPHTWIFGPQYHLATSDKGFREVIRRHRTKANLEPSDEAAFADIHGIDRIPDLFLTGQREYPAHPKHHHLLVEIKAPNVSIGRKERDQIHDYANIILDSSQFDKRSVRWDLFVISARVQKDLERERTQPNRAHGILYEFEGMNVYALEWCEIITSAREELRLVRDHLQEKSNELSVSDYLRENFPDVLASLETRLSPDDK